MLKSQVNKIVIGIKKTFITTLANMAAIYCIRVYKNVHDKSLELQDVTNRSNRQNTSQTEAIDKTRHRQKQ